MLRLGTLMQDCGQVQHHAPSKVPICNAELQCRGCHARMHGGLSESCISKGVCHARKN